MTKFSWIHISDWHQKETDAGHNRGRILRSFLADVKRRVEINPDLSKIDAVFFSGDISFSGKREEFNLAQSGLIDPLRTILGAGVRYVFCPGNHDVDRAAVDAINPDLALEFRKRCNTTDPGPLSDFLSDPASLEALKAPLRNYLAFCDENDQQYKAADLHYATKITLASGRTIGVASLNTAWACAHNRLKNQFDPGADGKVFDYGQLFLSEHQMMVASQKVADCDLKIAIMHHPHYWLSDLEQPLCEQHLFSEFDLVLHGHEHRPRVSRLQSTFGEVAIVPAGSSFAGRFPADARYLNSYNFGVYNFEANGGLIHQRVWDDERGWREDDRRLYRGTAKLGLLRPKINLTHAQLNILNDSKQRILPFLRKRVASFIEVERRTGTFHHRGRDMLSCRMQNEIHFPDEHAVDALSIKTMLDDRLRHLRSPRIKNALYVPEYVKIDGVDRDISQLVLSGELEIEIGPHVKEFRYAYKSLDSWDGVWIYRLNRFCERLRITVELSPFHDYDFKTIGGLRNEPLPADQSPPGFRRYEWAGLLFPGEGLLVQWWPRKGKS